ncbi:dihydroneopterin aldolase [Homoserinimonas sp. OAct 916]|uniref:dihydroneopterin aldolase n=1 Tax=Homoserinimonas sp. OAct 916 TaxID=2211450 RepID=UPI000DBE63CF|nr:dihydroneopterin aldolase [Homoserinimonas sp. OAct 916]
MTISELGDSITLTGLRVFAHHGVLASERQEGQEFVIDVTVWLDLAPAAAGDELTETIHYGELAVEVTDAVKHNPVDLIETVAERVAQVVLVHDAAIGVQVTVHKPSAPIDAAFDDVSVSITRMRKSASPVVGFGR